MKLLSSLGIFCIFALSSLLLVRFFAGKRYWKRSALGFLLVVVAVAITFCIYGWMPFKIVGKPYQIDRVFTADGYELCLTQTRTGTGEPYSVSFYSRFKDGPWSWYYIDHQGFYWWRGKIEIDSANGVATILRSDVAVAKFDWKSSGFTKFGRPTVFGSDKFSYADPTNMSAGIQN